MDNKNNICKKILLEFLDFIRFKVENDKMTMSDVESLAHMFEENLSITGTADDFAQFYNQSKTNISSVINRRMIKKPMRKVLYSFNAFRKIIPDKWSHT